MAKEKRSPEELSIDPAAQQMLIRADQLGIGTAFTRAADMAACNIGGSGMCCKLCGMGPCRLTKEGQTGVCGATLDTIQARNFIRAIAAGAAAHSDHGRDMAFTLKAVANGQAEGYVIRDVAKLRNVAAEYNIPIEGRSPEEIANDLADLYIAQFGQQKGKVAPVIRAPKKRQKLWEERRVVPRGVDREVVEALHRTHIGDDQDAEHILEHAVRTALSDGWGGSIIATDISDILFGTPAPILGQANLGVLKDDMVNVVVHGHEPTLSEMIVAASQDPEIIAYARKAGAQGINLSGICCTANEILMRQGIPAAGNFLQQELAILTGAVEAMVVDVQCIMQALVKLATNFHTKIITTSPKVRITGATHIEFDEHKALTIAKQILREAIDNYQNRGEAQIPDVREDLIPGFSHEYINYMLGGSYRASFRPLNDAIMAGRIRGVAAIVGCNNPRSKHDYLHTHVTRELLRQDVLVVETGCGAIASAKLGLLLGEAGLEQVGPGLREICETVGIPPVLHMGFDEADEHQRIGTARQTVKNFDFLLYAPLGRRIMVEVKGRTFAGTSLAGLKGLECWVTRDDVRGLGAWAKALGPGHEAAFVFAYRAARIDVDFDGRDVLCLGPDRYVFFCIRLEDYRRHMKERSVRWQTVTLSANHFRACAIDLPVLLK